MTGIVERAPYGWDSSGRRAAGISASRPPIRIYHGWFDLKPSVSDIALAAAIDKYMSHLQYQGLIAGWRLTRRKLGLGAAGLGEFHVMIEVKILAQLEEAFARVASRREPVEGFRVVREPVSERG
jgi:hypothetical protein